MTIETLRPNGVGSHTGLGAQPAGNNWSRVDEDPANDSDYVFNEPEEETDYDIYALPNSSVGAGVITNVRVIVRGRGTEE